jgi:prepilin-type N-terminal cleavage/methylation domain-containing protein
MIFYSEYKIQNTKYKIQDTRYKAFTLLELLIVIGITAVLSAVGVGFYVNQQKAKILDNTAQEIANYLRYAQQKSISQEQGQQWGVHFENPSSGSGFYALYTGTTYSSPIETKYLPAGIEFQTPSSGNSVNVSFNKLTGLNYSGVEQEIIIRLTSNQVARVIRIISNGLVVVGEGEKGCWKFDEGSGTTAYDSTIYKNNGTLVNGPIWQSSSNCISGSCLSFNGSTNYVEVSDNASLNPNSDNFTVEVWFKLNSVGTLNGSILYNKENLYEASAGGGYFTYAWQPHWNWDGGTSFPVNVGEWYHAVIVYDHLNQYVYKNGKLIYSRAQTGDIGTNTNALRIGARGAPGAAGSFFPGFIDELRIYNRALSSAEIQQHYNSRH